jgi:hypothetical protein
MLRVNDGGTAWPLPFTAWEDTMERRTHHSIHELLQQDRYTPEEVSELLGIGLDVIRQAAFAGHYRPISRVTTSSVCSGTMS